MSNATESHRDEAESDIYADLSGMITNVGLAAILALSFRRHAFLEPLSVISWPLVFLIWSYALFTYGQKGYLLSIRSKPYRGPLRLFLDVAIILLYFLISLRITEPGLVVWGIALILVFYAVWDFVKIWENRDYLGEKGGYDKARRRFWVTIATAVPAFVLAILYSGWAKPNLGMSGPPFDSVDVAFVFSEFLVLTIFWLLKSPIDWRIRERMSGIIS